MKKAKIITAAVLAATLLMGAGYASWNDNVKIKNSVETGTFNVSFDKDNCWVLPSDSLVNADMNKIESDNLYSTLKDTKTLEVTLKNMYPGSEVCVNTVMKNYGSIPAKFDNVEVSGPTGDNGLIQDLEVPFLYGYIEHKNGTVSSLPDVDSKGPIKLSQLQAKMNNLLSNVILQPGDTLKLQKSNNNKNNNSGIAVEDHFNIELPKDSTNITQNKEAKFDITISWKQVD
ncbi:SipW-dependent-type signal peptide-containing protein [Clostridium folliculivorans]|uniref:SipW-dependent-type signal peptide-containing protein n=1 Tax=Clostridium folliculivorans TaxID=2886038 RepID=UPI0021C2EF46|nr:SipW-dependent-type signal peptide-containing protein [Clostridium folliculivorans]GKU31618.1 hypothetical protein CFB3_37250 [Clostridium folliculivorans]